MNNIHARHKTEEKEKEDGTKEVVEVEPAKEKVKLTTMTRSASNALFSLNQTFQKGRANRIEIDIMLKYNSLNATISS